MKYRLIILIVLVAISLAATAAAGNIMENLMDNNRLANAPERDAVQSAIDNGKVIDVLIANSDRFLAEDLSSVAGPDDLAYGEPYKVAMANKELVKALLDGKKLSGTVLGLRHIWEVPVVLKNDPEQALCTFTVALHNGAWRVVEVGGFLAKDEIGFAANKAKQLEALRKNALDNGTSYVHLRIPAARMDYLYTESNNQEYFLKMNHRRHAGKNSITPAGDKKKQNRKEVMAEVETRLKELNDEPGKDGK